MEPGLGPQDFPFVHMADFRMLYSPLPLVSHASEYKGLGL